MARLELFAFGALRIALAGRPLPGLTSKKAQALLVYLATYHQRAHSRLVLAELFWPEIDEQRSRTSLRVELHKIRAVLEHGQVPPTQFLLADDTHVQFAPGSDFWLDTLAFTQAVEHGRQSLHRPNEHAQVIDSLVRAVDLYQDELLGNNYDEWSVRERERLGMLYEEALQQLTQAHLAQRQYEPAIAYARRALERNPLQEAIHRDLIYAYAVTGQQAAAITQYRACCAILDEELGIEPSPETRDLVAMIEAQTLSFTSATPELQRFVQYRDLATPLVGRREAMASLGGAHRLLRAGQGSCVLIAGESGIGKTRLLNTFAHIAADEGTLVIRGRCHELESIIAYQPVVEMLYANRHLFDEAVRAMVPAQDHRHLAELLPELFSMLPDDGPGGAPQPEGANQQIAACARLLVALAQLRGGLLVLLDDLQWADTGTLALIHYLGRQAKQVPVLLVGSIRTDEGDQSTRLHALVTSLGRDIPGEQLVLRRLIESELRQIVAETLGPHVLTSAQIHTLSQRLFAETAGNPFFAIETLRGLIDDHTLVVAASDDAGADAQALALPATLRDAILARLQPLSQTTRATLNLAATIGKTFAWSTLLHASEHDHDALLLALEDLIARHLIRAVDRDVFDFDHEKIREVVYQNLAEPRRRWLHTQVARVLEHAQTQPDQLAVEIAHHYYRSEEPAKAIRFLLMSGDNACRLQAYTEAEQHYRRALELCLQRDDREETAQTWMKLALNYMAAGDWKQATACQEQAFTAWSWLQQSRLPFAHTAQQQQVFRLVTSHGTSVPIDPTYGASREAWRVSSQLFEGLVQLDPRMNVVPCLATHWEVRNGGRVYRFHLRPDARWSDGTRLSAEDFVYAWRRNLRLASRSPLASLLFDIVGAQELATYPDANPALLKARALNDHLLEVELCAPVRYFLYVMALAIAFPLPRHAIEAHGNAWTDPARLVTNGPYRLVEHLPHKLLVLERSAHYDGVFTGNVGRVELFVESNPVRRTQLYCDDQVDLVSEMTYQEMTWARATFLNELIARPALNTTFLAFAWRHPPFDNLAVRQAFACAVDREQWARQTGYSAEQQAIGGFIPPGIAGHDPSIGPRFDPVRARQLLAEAGYPNGRGLGPLVMVSCQGLDDSNQYIQAQWREHLGVHVDVRIMETEPQMEQWLAGSYHILRQVRSVTYPDPDNWLRHATLGLQLVSPQASLINLVRTAATLMDERKRTELYREIDRQLVVDRATLLPFTYDTYYWLAKPWLSGYHYGAFAHWMPFKSLSIHRAVR